jgi:hypothetical protein
MTIIEANLARMAKQAADLTQLLNKLGWPEAHGPYFRSASRPSHVVGVEYTINIGYSTVLFQHDRTLVHHHMDIPQDPDVDVIAQLACEFLDWVTSPATITGIATMRGRACNQAVSVTNIPPAHAGHAAEASAATGASGS